LAIYCLLNNIIESNVQKNFLYLQVISLPAGVQFIVSGTSGVTHQRESWTSNNIITLWLNVWRQAKVLKWYTS